MWWKRGKKKAVDSYQSVSVILNSHCWLMMSQNSETVILLRPPGSTTTLKLSLKSISLLPGFLWRARITFTTSATVNKWPNRLWQQLNEATSFVSHSLHIPKDGGGSTVYIASKLMRPLLLSHHIKDSFIHFTTEWSMWFFHSCISYNANMLTEKWSFLKYDPSLARVEVTKVASDVMRSCRIQCQWHLPGD